MLIQENLGASASDEATKPVVKGKFLFVGTKKFWVLGVTYGPFRPDAEGCEYHTPERVDRDFAQMAAHGINTVRTYTVPPLWLLDCAQQHGLRVMVGLPWEQHVTFLDSRARVQSIEKRIQAGIRSCRGHPAVFAYAIGNEIPANIVRWYGRQRIERFIKRLYTVAKKEDCSAIVTYVNYPTTEYLRLPFLDFICFNVYLESQDRLSAYLARIQNLAGDKPLVMAEIGLDSRRNDEEVQARVLDWQIHTVFESGSAGLFVFAWTDEWHRGGFDIEDWDFGLTTRDRSGKPALVTVQQAYTETPFPPDIHWPRVSVAVCSYNGARTIRDCLEGLKRLEYPDYEVIVVSDGSTDATADIVREYNVRLICTENRGLSSARNTAMEAATGEIIAYIDDDAYPDPHWLMYLAKTFLDTSHAGVGGPNLAPPGDGPIADCVACAPGGPVHVLLSDREAEHIPGCNMAFRTSVLKAVGGFDTTFRIAGDDVDLCWRLLKMGWTIGFSPVAVVWHHRRNSVKAYWKQQFNYGKAEALLEMKWPQKYNALGHVSWQGRLYGPGLHRALLFQRWRVYHGVWGSGLFQSLYETHPEGLASLPLMPEWYLIIGTLIVLSAFSLIWSPLWVVLPFLAAAVGAVVVQAFGSASHASFPSEPRTFAEKNAKYLLTAGLYMLQPMARLLGRLRLGLTPWHHRGRPGFRFPKPQTQSIWSEEWHSQESRLEMIESALYEHGAVVRRGGEFDRWDMEVEGGLFGKMRTCMTVEEHGAGKQLIRVRSWPRVRRAPLVLTMFFAILEIMAVVNNAWWMSLMFGLVIGSILLLAFTNCGVAAAVWLTAVEESASDGKMLSGTTVVPSEAPDSAMHGKQSSQAKQPSIRS